MMRAEMFTYDIVFHFLVTSVRLIFESRAWLGR